MRSLHQCLGYLREEITLASDVSRSAIVSHAFLNQGELCSMCGQLVQYTHPQSPVTDEEIEPSGGTQVSNLPQAAVASSSGHDQNASNRHSSLTPQSQSPSSPALIRALDFAREAVQIDSINDDPVAAVSAYTRSLWLLNQVLERVRNSENTTVSLRRRSRSSIFQEKDIRRLEKIVS